MHRTGYDLTFGAPKTASVLMVVHGDQELLKAWNESVAETLAEIEKTVTTRQMVDGVNQTIVTGKAVIATFNHDTSRDLDPHVHTHNVFLNATPTEAGWRTLATDTKGKSGFIEHIFAQQIGWGNSTSRTSVRRLRRWGISRWIPDPTGCGNWKAFQRRSIRSDGRPSWIRWGLMRHAISGILLRWIRVRRNRSTRIRRSC